MRKKWNNFKSISVILLALVAVVLSPIAIHAMVIHGGGSEFGWIVHTNPKTHNHSTLTTTLKKLDNGDYAYCLNSDKASPVNLDYKPGKKMDDEMFRVVENGYPNKKFTGDQKKDYYITQVAVWIENGNYKRKDLSGSMLKYVDQLLDKAKKGDSTAKTWIKFNTKNVDATLSSDGKYYITPFMHIEGNNVSGKIKLELSGAPAGSQFIDKENRTGPYFKIGEEFKLRVPVSEALDETQIKISASGKLDSKAALFFTSPDSKFQNTVSYTTIPVSEKTGDDAVVNITPVHRQVRFRKVDSETGKPLAGATFDVSQNGKSLGKFTSQASGIVRLSDLKYGVYQVKEVQAPKGYVLLPKTYTVNLTELNKGRDEIKAPNSPIRGNVVLTKTDTDKKVMQGVKFELYREQAKDEDNSYILDGAKGNKNLLTKAQPTGKDGNKLIGIYETDKDGKITVDGLLNGNYFFKEVKTNEGYVLNQDPVKFTISNNGATVNVSKVNKKITGKIQITKVDASSGKLLPDTKFKIYDSNGKVVAEGKTDKNGIYEFGPLKYGKYYYQEVEAPKGYNIDSQKYPFEIKQDGEIVKCRMKDTKLPKTGDIRNSNTAIFVCCGLVAISVLGFAFSKKRA